MTLSLLQTIIYGVIVCTVGPLIWLFLFPPATPRRPEGFVGAPDQRWPRWETCPCCGQPLRLRETYSDGRSYVFRLGCSMCGFRVWHDGRSRTSTAPPQSFVSVR